MTEEPSQSGLRDLCSKVHEDLRARIEWEKRQETWAKMRHDGLRRTNLPWPNAADLHFPLGDTFVERHKPFYVQQLRASQEYAQFQPRDVAAQQYTAEVASWFDYKLKCRSNFQEEILYIIDGMLELGSNVLKITWDVDKKRLSYEAIDPLYIIVPKGTEGLQECDRLTHVIQMSPDAYERREDYDQGVLASIKGATQNEGLGQTFTYDKYRRQGINYTEATDTIIVWETYERDGDGWMVYTYSPVFPDKPIKKPFRMAYKHGRLPFVRYRYEIKDRGWYDNRGLVELAAPFEASLCKDWNEQQDYKTLVNRPLFYSESPITNTSNLRWLPGTILPHKIGSVQLQQPPISFDTGMNFTRSIAEYRVAMPDYGIGNAQTTNDARTATEVAAIGAVSSQNVDLRAFVFRLANTETFLQSWELLLQYDSEDLMYVVGGTVRTMSPEGLQAAMEIEPSGTNDGSTKENKVKKAWGRLQIFNGNPYVNQGELVKTVLEADDEGLVRRLYQDPQQKSQSEYEDEGVMIPSLLLGNPIQPRPEQDQNARLQALTDYMQLQMQRGLQPDPVGAHAIANRIQGHISVLEKKNPLQAKQWESNIAAIMQQAQPIQAMEAPRKEAA